MPRYPAESSIASNAATIAERLIAHARLCRNVAELSGSEETARRLDTLAEECVRAAAALAPDPAEPLQ